jgi:hypothetical protein
VHSKQWRHPVLIGFERERFLRTSLCGKLVCTPRWRTSRCCNCTLAEGEKPHPASYRGCNQAKWEQQRRRAQRAPKELSGRTLFVKFTLAEQSYAAKLRQETQQQQPQAPKRDGRSVQHPIQQHLPQQEFQRTGLSVHSSTSSDIDKLKVATVVQQIMKDQRRAK